MRNRAHATEYAYLPPVARSHIHLSQKSLPQRKKYSIKDVGTSTGSYLLSVSRDQLITCNRADESTFHSLSPPKSAKSQKEVSKDNAAPKILGRDYQEFLNCLICAIICVLLKRNLSHGQVILSPLNKLLISEIAIKRKGLFIFLPIGKVSLHLSSL